ncbi:non-ribosomal peptide synthetase [Bacillus wiedmannii]|uniref:non-ribosomal peptide synthetase n=1 Tax=Bacillus wiedmannii TaxID=1890302 RepID=UPI000BEF43D5|nr:non-ribosomal peptide synthetase [Bacillus wiedmannii]PEM18976.1 hypothetical protein CN617_31540 [Bacillus wiedmannii]
MKTSIEEKCLHELFEEQVKRTPQQEAVIYEKNSLNYLELETASNKLAHYLIQNGIQCNDVVPICIERSLELVVGLLAILKSGGAFLPLDTEAPPDRLIQILSEVNPKVSLVQSSFSEVIKAGSNNIIEVNLKNLEFHKFPSVKPQVEVGANDLVSVYFTSGSTGIPKGVANTHKGWVNRFIWMQREFNLKEGETVLQKTTLSFDDSAIELFWPLISGARVAMMKPYMHKDPRAIIDAAIMYKTIHLQFVPSMLDMVLDEVTNEDIKRFDSLRSCVSSGEALNPDTVKRYLNRLPGKLCNTWGATEASIDSTIHTCTIEDTLEHGAVSVGKPIDNNRVYVLDENRMPVPKGVVGELYIAGVGLAKGYLNNKAKTEQSFLEDPFVKGERMYKTGDLGYFRKDGSIKFIGRADNQVKIRGMRVELGEIEYVIRKKPTIKDAVVLVKETDNIKRLIAFIVPSDLTKDVDIETLRESLSKELPDYMVPSFYFPITKFPLNSNGKVDRNHLMSLDVSFKEKDKEYVLPQTMAEEVLVNLWTALLKLDQVSVQDNFFKLGGHSLIATQLVSRIRSQLGIELPLSEVFLKPVLKELAEEIEKRLVNKIDSLSDEETNVWLDRILKS